MLLTPLLVLQMQSMPRDNAATRSDMGQGIADMLRFLQASADPTGRYPTLMDRAIAEALQGDPSLLDLRFRRAVPDGAEFNVLLDNGRGTMKLLSERSPGGEAISRSRLWTPGWGPLLAVPAVELLDAQRSALRLQAVPLHRAFGLGATPGVHAEVEFELPGGGRFNRTAFAAVPNRTAEGPSASISLLDGGGARAYHVRPAIGNATLFLAVDESQGRAVPSGTRLEARLPPGFTDVHFYAPENPGWGAATVTGNATYGWVVEVPLAGDLGAGMRQVMINATRPAWGVFHRVDARLDGALLGRMEGLVLNTSSATASGALGPGRGPFLSLPGLAPWSVRAPGGLVVAYPDDTARTLTVTRVTLRAQGGLSLIAGQGDFPGSGWVGGDGALEWTGSRALARDEALEFRFSLKATAPADPSSAATGGLHADLLNGHTPLSWSQASAGLFEARAAPRNASAQGFVATAGAHTATLNATHREAALSGDASYETVANALVEAMASDLVRGLDESFLQLDEPTVHLGGTGAVTWNMTRLRDELVGAAGQAFHCYQQGTPGPSLWADDRPDCLDNHTGLSWQLRDVDPAVSLRVFHPSPSGPAWPVAYTATGLAMQGSASFAIAEGGMVGTHVVELRAAFRLEGPSGAVLDQVVRLLGSFEVLRPGGGDVARPLYDVVVQAWMPEWG